MASFESLKLTTDIPLYELDKTLSSTSSEDVPVRPAEARPMLADERRCINIWCILAYATPSMPIQFYFTMFTVYLIPYLMTTLGLTAFQVSLVLLAGPLSGLTASPVFGILSDRSGRRFIYFAAGSIAMSACQLVLGWSRELVGGDLVAARWVSTAAVFVGCMSVRACIVGFRLLSIDNVPPHQQPVMNLISGLMGSVGSIGTLIAGFVKPSFQLITLICATGILLSIFPVWAVRPTECYKPVVKKERRGFGTAILSVPRDMWDGRTSLPPKIRHEATRAHSYEAASPELITQAGVRVLLIAQVGGFLIQMVTARLWDPSRAPGGGVRRLMNEDMVALRRIWALVLLILGLSTLGAILLRTSFTAASICIASIMYIAPLSGFVPLAIISYEAAVIQTEKGCEPSQTSTGMFFSYFEMAITVGQGLSALGNAIINFGIGKIQLPIENSTALLFPPGVIGAIIAVLVC
ncbi:sucrose transporter [Colletotrichum cereale]|nr:sucrose transporter [Colletotrichum cereale]